MQVSPPRLNALRPNLSKGPVLPTNLNLFLTRLWKLRLLDLLRTRLERHVTHRKWRKFWADEDISCNDSVSFVRHVARSDRSRAPVHPTLIRPAARGPVDGTRRRHGRHLRCVIATRAASYETKVSLAGQVSRKTAETGTTEQKLGNGNW